MAESKSHRQLKHQQLREEHFKGVEPWMKAQNYEAGFFMAPRSLPLILRLLDSPKVSEKEKPSRVYLELFSHRQDGGLIAMKNEDDHAYAAGFKTAKSYNARGQRSWRDRMRLLVRLGFIKPIQAGRREFAYVMIVHPALAVEGLMKEGKVDPEWWSMYRDVQLENDERSAQDVQLDVKKGFKSNRSGIAQSLANAFTKPA